MNFLLREKTKTTRALEELLYKLSIILL